MKLELRAPQLTYRLLAPAAEKKKLFFWISWGKLSPKILIEHGANNEEELYTGDPAVMALNGEISLDLMGIIGIS